MRQVLRNTDEVFHVWASQSQASGESGNISFSGPRVYSYAACIGQIVTNPKGQRAVLLASRRWSVTTSKHQNQARGAARHLTPFYVPDPGATPTANRDALARRIEQATAEIPQGHNRPARAKRLLAVQHQIESANAFCRFFGLPILPTLETPDEDINQFCAQLQARQAIARAKADAKAKRETARRVKEAQSALAQWLAGEPVSRSQFSVLPGHHLRINDDQVETTLGAYVPLAHVQRVAPLLLSKATECRSDKTAWVPDRPIHLGHYTLDRITDTGAVHIGCHRFEFTEVCRFAAILDALALVVA